MQSTPDVSAQRRRLSLLLLLAALTYVVGVSVGPWLHQHGPEVLQAEAGREGSAPRAPLHDSDCAVCTALGAPALPAGEHAVVLTPEAALRALPLLLSALHSSPLPLHQARAPPSA